MEFPPTGREPQGRGSRQAMNARSGDGVNPPATAAPSMNLPSASVPLAKPIIIPLRSGQKERLCTPTNCLKALGNREMAKIQAQHERERQGEADKAARIE